MKNFKINKKSSKSFARTGEYKTAHGKVKIPFFMPVATQGVLKHITTEEIRKIGFECVLSNTYHLMLRPGEKEVKRLGGLHGFMDWNKSILTDSGGFQVFSLGSKKEKTSRQPTPSASQPPLPRGESLVKLSEEGVKFKSYIDGKEFFLTPEKAFQVQADLGVDIAVCLDECVALPAERKYVEESVELTTRWAKRALEYKNKKNKENKVVDDKNKENLTPALSLQRRGSNIPLLHCVIQGGLDKELRLKSLRDLKEMDFDGYNIGGLSVGETPKDMYKVLDWLAPELPIDKPRYLMGVGYPDNIIEAVKRGIDMFDCVIPTREGRHGRLFVFNDSNIQRFKDFYKSINILNSKFAFDKSAINSKSKLPELKGYSKAYLHYLFKIKEPLGQRLATLNNLEFYFDLMMKLRQGIRNDIL